MRIVNYSNRNCLDLKDKNGDVVPFQLLITSTSGSGKGTATESIVERWKKTTGGIVLAVNDPKNEAESSFVMYQPEARYHLQELKKDGIKKNKYPCKLYHPYTHNLSKKGYLPKMEIYSLSIKDMTKWDWSILAETDEESETIKLLERVSEDLPRNSSLFDFLLEIERLTEGKKDKKKSLRDPKNWGLKSGGGTAKSVKQVGNMLSSFKKHYFLRKDTCDLKLDWDKILLNPTDYHVFLTNYIDNPKLRNFLVVSLIGQAIKHAQRLSDLGKLKKPIMFVIPELLNVCPSDTKGSSLFLAKTLRQHLVTARSQAQGVFFCADTQNWSQTSSEVRGAFNQTFYGKLNPEDARVIFKANSYTADKRELFKDIEEEMGAFIWYKNEDYGAIKLFMPSHMHKEIKYNWIQMYKNHFKDQMVRYDDLVKIMRKEFEEEESVIDELTKKEKLEEVKNAEEKESKKQDKKDTNNIKSQDRQKDIAKEYLYKRSWELHKEGFSDHKIAKEIGVKSNKTAKKYYEKYELKLKEEEKEQNNPERILPNLGDGILSEEIESNFNSGDIDSE